MLRFLRLAYVIPIVAVSVITYSTFDRSASEDDPETFEVPARWAGALAEDIPNLLAATDANFSGEVVALRELRTDLPPQQLQQSGFSNTKPQNDGPDGFPISVYEVRVIDVVSGTLEPGDIVLMEQPGGAVERDGEKVNVVLEGDERLRIGTQYLFFAATKANGTWSGPPFARFRLVDGLLEPPEQWSGTALSRLLGGVHVSHVAEEINRDAQ